MKHCPNCNAPIIDGARFCPRCGIKQVSPLSSEERNRNPYFILQVASDADPDVVDAAYRSLARKYHPDLNLNTSDQERMKEINWAHDVLADPVKRKDWNQRNAAGRASSPNPNKTTPPSPSGQGSGGKASSTAQTSSNAQTETSRPTPTSSQDLPNGQVPSSSPLPWIGLGLIVLLVLVFFPLQSGGQTVAFTPSVSTAIPTAPPRPIPTRIPDPTNPDPTKELVSENPLLNSGCIKWSNVDAQLVGHKVCVYGIVVLTKGNSSQGPYTIQFSNNWHDFKVQDFNYYYADILPGMCIVVQGTVGDNVSFLIILPNKGGGINFYNDANYCR